ncbi:MAG: polysaccharide deacetylase family protein [Mesorhizobium sp.]
MSNPRVPHQLSIDRKKLPPPGGKPLIVHIVVNLEYWPFDRAMPRKLQPNPHGMDKVPDVPNFSWVEYGMRAGYPRILRSLEQRGIKATAAINAQVVQVYPRVAETALEAGWEFMGHGVTQRALQDSPDEVEIIDKTLSMLKDFTGTDVKGWLGPGLSESFDTPDHLKAGGIEYVCDWVIDDLPTWMQTKHGPLIAAPYSLDLNDGPLWAGWSHASDAQYLRAVETLETFDAELQDNCRVLVLPLHPHLVGVPHRITWFNRILDLLQERSDAVFMTGNQIAQWYAEVEPAPAEFTRV